MKSGRAIVLPSCPSGSLRTYESTYFNIVTVSCKIFGLERMSDYRGCQITGIHIMQMGTHVHTYVRRAGVCKESLHNPTNS